MDIFLEYIVRHRTTGQDTLIKAGTVFLAVILTFVIVFVLFGRLFGLEMLVLAGIYYGTYQVFRSRNVEFEYIMTNSDLDIDRIIAKSRRKRFVSVDFKEIELCAAIDDPDHKYEYENKEGITKTFDCTGNWQTAVYFVDFSGTNGKQRVLFQPPSRIIEEAYKFNPRKVFIKR